MKKQKLKRIKGKSIPLNPPHRTRKKRIKQGLHFAEGMGNKTKITTLLIYYRLVQRVFQIYEVPAYDLSFNFFHSLSFKLVVNVQSNVSILKIYIKSRIIQEESNKEI